MFRCLSNDVKRCNSLVVECSAGKDVCWLSYLSPRMSGTPYERLAIPTDTVTDGACCLILHNSRRIPAICDGSFEIMSFSPRKSLREQFIYVACINWASWLIDWFSLLISLVNHRTHRSSAVLAPSTFWPTSRNGYIVQHPTNDDVHRNLHTYLCQYAVRSQIIVQKVREGLLLWAWLRQPYGKEGHFPKRHARCWARVRSRLSCYFACNDWL